MSSWMLRFPCSEIVSSRSIISQPSRRASALATLVLPAAMYPTMTMRRCGRFISSRECGRFISRHEPDASGPSVSSNSPPVTSSPLRQRFEHGEEFREGYGDALLRALYLALAFGGERGDGEGHRDAEVAERLQARAAQTCGAVDAPAHDKPDNVCLDPAAL